MNKKIIIAIAIVVLALAGIIFYATRPIPLGKPLQLKDVLAKNVAENGKRALIDLRTVGNFDWNTLYILSPYRKEIKGLRGMEKVFADAKIEPNTCILLFAEGDVVNGFAVVPRNIVDFSLLSEKYPREKANFRLQKRPFNGPGNKPWYNVIL